MEIIYILIPVVVTHLSKRNKNTKSGHFGSSQVAQRVKDLTLSLLWPRFDPIPSAGTSTYCRHGQKKKKIVYFVECNLYLNKFALKKGTTEMIC